MCGITAYIGDENCREFVLEGLSRLEYRGYDSAGFVCVDGYHGHLSFQKASGRLSQLQSKLATSPQDGPVGMGHTRWATHGVANEANAHPHFDCQKAIAVVHNGIIEQYNGIRKQLIEDGHEFSSDTDSEVIAHLFESLLPKYDTVHEAVVALTQKLKGAYAIVLLLEAYPDQLIILRRRSPLAVGFGKNETYVASDPLVFSDRTKKVCYMPDSSFAFVKKGGIELYDFWGKELEIPITEVDHVYDAGDKKGFKHFMLKEIYEQKQAIDRTIQLYRSITEQPDEHAGHTDPLWEQLGLSSAQIKGLKKIHLVACGTSWNASRISQFFFESVAKIPTSVHLASEFRYMPFFPDENSIYLFVSQSGETADTLEAMRMVNDVGIPTVALTNVASSTMVQEANGFLLFLAGPELAVASTKAFSCQIASLYWLCHRIALEQSTIDAAGMQRAEEDLFVTAELLEATMEQYKHDIVTTLAKRYVQFNRYIFLGRHASYPFAMEAALKLKEISYIFSQCYPSGELKHGPIALIDEKTPVVMFSSLDATIYEKSLGNAQEVKARKGHLVVFAFEGQHELIALADHAFIIPKVAPLLGPLAMTGVMQLFVYYITCELGLPIDKPRNLAKSVSVE